VQQAVALLSSVDFSFACSTSCADYAALIGVLDRFGFGSSRG